MGDYMYSIAMTELEFSLRDLRIQRSKHTNKSTGVKNTYYYTFFLKK